MNKIIDQATQVRKEDQLDEKKLHNFLKNQLPNYHSSDNLSIKQFSGGASNLTYLLSWREQQVILRTSPRGANIKSAHDMGREYRVLSLLNPHFSYAPKAILMCDDINVIGREFYLMQKIEGIIPRKKFPMAIDSIQARKICQELIDVHVSLHQIDINKTKLDQLGHPQGYISRQISGWNKRYKNARISDSIMADDLMVWLDENQPQDETSCLIHNDYKLDNVVLSPDDPTKIIAILDWEMATIGSPLMDLGCSLAYWIQKDDSPALQAISMMPTMIDGMMTRDEIVAYYSQKSGLKVDDFSYYYVFGLFRLAVIVQQIFKRFVQGQTNNPAFKGFGQVAKILIKQAQKYI